MNTHRINIAPAATLPGMLIISFLDPQPEITTAGGNPARLAQDGCAVDELGTHLSSLEAQHGIRILRPGQIELSNPVTGGAVVTLHAGPK